MAYIEVIGGRHLHGEIDIHGSKNAVLPILAASILHKGITKIKYCPKIIDVFSMIRLMESIGCIIIWDRDQLIVDATELNYNVVDKQYVSSMRSSIILLGSLLGRNKRRFNARDAFFNYIFGSDNFTVQKSGCKYARRLSDWFKAD